MAFVKVRQVITCFKLTIINVYNTLITMQKLQVFFKLLKFNRRNYFTFTSQIKPSYYNNNIKKSFPYKKSVSSQQGFVCWKCGLKNKNSTNLFCEECKIIQNPYGISNYFSLFNLEEKFNIDVKELQTNYRILQTYLHPDKFVNKSEEEKSISLDYSSLVNKAYNRLQVPIKRAEHLLELKGDKLNEDFKIDEDKDFLMEMMELNEEFENSDNNIEKLKAIDVKNQNQLETIIKSIDECFKRNDLTQAKYFIVKLKYYSSLGNRINAQLRELGVVN